MNNNPGGIKKGGVYKSYKTKEEGLKDMSLVLNRLLEQAGGDLKKMRLIYCPISDEGCVGDYDKFIEIYKSEKRRLNEE